MRTAARNESRAAQSHSYDQQHARPPRQAPRRCLGHAPGPCRPWAAARSRSLAHRLRRPRVPAAPRNPRRAHAARADEARHRAARPRHREHHRGLRQRALSQRRRSRRADRRGRQGRRHRRGRALAPAGAQLALLREGAHLRQAGRAPQREQGAAGQALHLHRRRSRHHAGGQPRRARGRRPGRSAWPSRCRWRKRPIPTSRPR